MTVRHSSISIEYISSTIELVIVSRLQLSSVQEFYRQIHMSTSQKFGHIFSEEIISARAAHASIKMIMEEEVDGPDIREFEAILKQSVW